MRHQRDRRMEYCLRARRHRDGGDRQKRGVFVSWTPHNRASALAEALGAEYYCPAPRALGFKWPLRYAFQGIATVLAILRRWPDFILFTNPPCVSGAVCVCAGRLVGAQVWSDTHSGAYNNPDWTRFSRLNASVIRRCTGAIFHNDVAAEMFGRDARQKVVVSVFSVSGATLGAGPNHEAGSRVAVVCSYGFDEPLEAVLGAVEQLQDTSVLFTGDAPERLRERAPDGAAFTGWLADTAYARLLASADVIVSLTTREATMQNGLVEGLQHGVPVITSDTAALRRWATGIDGVALVKADATDIARTIRLVCGNKPAWRAAAERGRREVRLRMTSELAHLQNAIGVADGEARRAAGDSAG